MIKNDFDESVRPQDDFFGYVNNNWLKGNPIPPCESSWGTFYILRDESWKALDVIVKELLKTPDDDLSHDQKLLKTFFSTAMSFSGHREKHLGTLDSELQKIQKISSKNDLAKYLGYAHRHNYPCFWLNYVDLDDKNSQMQVLRILQGGLNLPNRDYYLEDNIRMNEVRNAYKDHYENVAKLLPKQLSNQWDAVLDIETKLARSSWTDVELRDVHKNYNKSSLDDLQERFPNFDWKAYFKAMGWKKVSDNIIINQPSFVESAFKVIDEKSLDDIKAYLSWCVVNNLLNWIDDGTAQASFEFYGKVISGAKEMKPLWQRAILQADSLVIGEALGREYAIRHFPESSKHAVMKIVADIYKAYHERINHLIWMNEETKKVAHVKLDNIKVFVGYPSKWRDLGKLVFSNDNHLKNILTARALTSDMLLEKIGQTPADEDWLMNSHTVNAYNHPNRLEIVFPAAILQPPFYDPSASYAANLGGIGAVIGHELTHGFDDQGAEFDEFGNINPWQSSEERSLFKKLSKTIIKQADSFESVPGVYLQGKLILGEAIADIGGLELAIEALRMKTGRINTESLRELLVSFAIAERGTATKERLIELAKVDPHPPSRFRINCVINHIDSFYDAYDVKPGDGLYLPSKDRARIW